MTRLTPSVAHSRLEALDGLRGVAAVVVVFSHALLTTTIADDYVQALSTTGTSDAVGAIIANTPLRYLFMGNEAVVVFFVLSGLVLTLPMMRGKGLDLWAYYPRRILRLWIPVAASVVFAIVIILLTNQNPANAPNEWVKKFSFPTLGPQQIGESFFMITGRTDLNNPLWSLKWEMLFSLFLPAVFLISTQIKRHYWAVIIACGVVAGIGSTFGVLALKYGPMFIAGAVAAKMIATAALPRTALASWGLVGGGVLLLGLPDFGRVVLQAPFPFSAALQASITIGATMIVLGLTVPSGITALFGSAGPRFLGRISFSLYLVHAPILIGAVHLAPEHVNLVLAASIPAAFVISWVFTHYIEVPSANLSRQVGQWASAAISKQKADRLGLPASID